MNSLESDFNRAIKMLTIEIMMKRLIKFMESIRNIYCRTKRNLEPIGLLFLLVAFGWQCLEEHSNNAVYEDYVYHIYEKLDAIWNASYEEYVHSEHYQKECIERGINMALFWFDHEDASKRIFKQWNATKEDLQCIEEQRDFGWTWRVCLYVLGTIMIILSKCRRLPDSMTKQES